MLSSAMKEMEGGVAFFNRFFGMQAGGSFSAGFISKSSIVFTHNFSFNFRSEFLRFFSGGGGA